MGQSYLSAGNSPLVLCYHAVSDTLQSGLAVTTDNLREQVALLAERGYQSVTFAELERRRANGADVAKLACLTFDDGYASTLTAGEILAEHGFVGTVYVLPETVGQAAPLRWPGIEQWADGPHADELRPLDWAGVESLVEGGWEIGSHTLTHPHLTQCSAASIAAELGESRAQIAARVGGCETVAYPYGDADGRVAAAARAAGYAAGTTLSPWHRHDSQYLRPRVGVFRRDDLPRFKLKIARWTRRMRALPQLVVRSTDNAQQDVG